MLGQVKTVTDLCRSSIQRGRLGDTEEATGLMAYDDKGHVKAASNDSFDTPNACTVSAINKLLDECRDNR